MKNKSSSSGGGGSSDNNHNQSDHDLAKLRKQIERVACLGNNPSYPG